MFSDERLIFLVSQPRCGSTMLQVILAGLEPVYTTSEPWIMLHPVYALRETGHTAEYNAVIAHRALEDFTHHLPHGRASYLSALREMGLTLYGQASQSHGKSWFLDKTPRYYQILPELQEIFPKAWFIFLWRNPLAIFHSIAKTWVKGDLSLLRNFYNDLLVAPQKLIEGSRAPQIRSLSVHYETLVKDPGPTVEHICNWLGLPYSEDLLAYGTRPSLQGRYGDPTGLQKRTMPSGDSAEAWRTMADDTQLRQLALGYLRALGEETVQQMGYDFETLQAAMGSVDPGDTTLLTWEELINDPENASVALRSRFYKIRRLRATVKEFANNLTGS